MTLFLSGVLFGTASCGKDEATGGSPSTGKVGYCEPCDSSSDCGSGNVCRTIADKVGVCAKSTDTQCCVSGTMNCHTNLGPSIDGSGGSAGSGIINNGGKGGKAGSGGTGGGVSKQTHLGSACVNDEDCGDDNLTCIGSTGLSDGTGVPKGLCSMPCEAGSDCLDLYDNSFCFEFNADDHYCIEGCTTGTLGQPKCHERDEIACSLIGLIPSDVACDTNADCGSQQLCNPDTGFCGDSVTGCVPLCAGDFDCGDKEYCDFATGMCTEKKPTGLANGEVCKPPTGNAEDPCQGFCDTGTDPKQGICESLCVLSNSLAGCGWDGATPKPDNVCLFGTILSPPGDAVFGDVGICGALCDCNDQCLKTGDYCIDETGQDVEAIWGRQGYCRPLDTGETVKDTYQECPAGVGGSGNGSAGESGSGTGGTSNGSAGEGGAPSTAGGGGQAGG